MRYFFIILFVGVLNFQLHGQALESLPGKVSFISSHNVYVKFISTDGILPGDTLFIPSDKDLVPALLVNNLSSTSCVCTLISSENLTQGQLIIARLKPSLSEASDKVSDTLLTNTEAFSSSDSTKIQNPKVIQKRNNGSISVNSYSDFSNTKSDDSQRFRYTFSFRSDSIAQSGLSFDSYVSFKYKSGDLADSNVFDALKIYGLSLRYDLNKSSHLSLGRRINPKISNIGSFDGLQIEKSFGRVTVGAISGFRPDYEDFGFNGKLFQYGGYFSLSSNVAGKYTESSIAFMQQMNNSKTDRRFMYFQHSNSIIKNLYFFSSIEIDLYQLIQDSLNSRQSQNKFIPTGLYLSLRAKLARNLSLTGSYDARKNVIYYETFKSFIDRVIEDEMRQSFRLQANYRMTRDLMIGLQSGFRLVKTDPHSSKNLYGYLTYSHIPGIKASGTLSATILQTSYLNGRIYGINIYRDFLKGKLSTSLGFRYVDYLIPENKLDIIQNIGEINLSLQLPERITVAVSYEGTFEIQDSYNRIYVQLRKRF